MKIVIIAQERFAEVIARLSGEGEKTEGASTLLSADMTIAFSFVGLDANRVDSCKFVTARY